MLFGGELWTDWDFIYKRNYNTGELTLSETYPNIFQKTFKGKKCSVYELEDICLNLRMLKFVFGQMKT